MCEAYFAFVMVSTGMALAVAAHLLASVVKTIRYPRPLAMA